MPEERAARVCHICPTGDGAYWMVQILAGLRDRHGYDVAAIITADGGSTAENLRATDIPYAVVPHAVFSTSRAAASLGRLPGRLADGRFVVHGAAILREALPMARVLRRFDADVVHAHVFQSIIVGRVAGALARIPARVSMVPGPYQLEAPGLLAIDLATGWLEHRTIGGSRRVDDLYARAGVPARRRRFVPYGADPDVFRPETSDPALVRAELGIDAETPLVGQVAHFYNVPDGPYAPPPTRGRGLKGHEDHLAAAALVLEARPDARFVFAGAGLGEAGEAHRAAMVQRSRTLGLEQAVSFLGPRSDVPDVLAALDVSVQCSLSENYGGTIESLLMERPTVATRVGGMPEVVRHERTGLLVPPRDPRALADAILRLIADRELGRRLGAAGRRLVVEGGYTTGACVDGIARVYSEMGMVPRLPLRPLNR